MTKYVSAHYNSDGLRRFLIRIRHKFMPTLLPESIRDKIMEHVAIFSSRGQGLRQDIVMTIHV